MEVTCDFQRFYGITLPTGIARMPLQTVYDLMMGLLKTPGSLYLAWSMSHFPPSGEGASRRSIPFEQWSAQTSLLMDIRNLLMGYMTGEKDDTAYVHPPESEGSDSVPRVERDVTFDEMRALLS